MPSRLARKITSLSTWSSIVAKGFVWVIGNGVRRLRWSDLRLRITTKLWGFFFNWIKQRSEGVLCGWILLICRL